MLKSTAISPENDGVETVAGLPNGNAVETEVIAPVLEHTPTDDLKAITKHIDNNEQLKSHLERARLAEIEANAAADRLEKIQSEVLPANYADTLALLKEAQKSPVATPAEKKLRDARIAKITQHVHALANPPVSPKLNVTHLSNWRPVVGAGGRKAALDQLAAKYPLIAELREEITAQK